MEDQSIADWFRKLRKPIRSWMIRKQSVYMSEADDLTQEVFERFLKYSNDTSIENPKSYIFKIAANVASEWRDKARIRREHKSEWIENLQDDEFFGPESTINQFNVRDKILRELERLPNRQRKILLLHAVDGLSYNQIAVSENVTYRIVLRDLTRAYSALRLSLSDCYEKSSWPMSRKRGRGKSTTKLTGEEVIEIRQKRDSGISIQALVEFYGVSRWCVESIIHRQSWKDI